MYSDSVFIVKLIIVFCFITGGGPAPKTSKKFEAVLEAQSRQVVEGFAGVEAETGIDAELPLVGY